MCKAQGESILLGTLAGPPLASLYHCLPLLTCLTANVVLPIEGVEVSAPELVSVTTPIPEALPIAPLPLPQATQGTEVLLLQEDGELGPGLVRERTRQVTTSVTCDFSDVRFSAEFPQGRFGRCERGEDGRVIIHLEPETTPINPSPWHAFTVQSDSERTIGIEIRSEYAETRYSPKMSVDRQTWKVMEYEREGSAQYFTVEVGAEKVWIAGQELFDNNDYQVWLAQLQERFPQLVRTELGRSVEDREIPALVHYTSGNEWLILLGRQHPPEITGAMAMRNFVETLLSDESLSEAFLARYNVLIAPNLNPDGVAAGNWRANANGVDLNRDWFSLEQPETQAVDEFIHGVLEAGGSLVYGVDFHSTFRDVFYTTPGDYLSKEPDFSYDWLNSLAAAVAPNPIREQPSANPAQGNFKQYMADTHGTHAVTYEVADNSDRLTIGLIATHAATTLMDYMLTRPLPLVEPSS